MAKSSRTKKRRNKSLNESQLMSSSNDPMTDELLCSICLDVFNDPVSTPCGHNFCKICLNTYWDSSQNFSCPNCKEIFNQRPELKINTTLREVAHQHKKKTAEKQPEVLCDICEKLKRKAVKSCLVCQSSYCETHLGRHLTVTGLQKHKLIDPVNNLQDYICLKHERPLELFCRDDQTPVCLSCADGDHKNHNTVTLEEEIKEKTQTDVQQMIQDRIKKIQDIEHSAELRRLLERMEEKQKEAEKKDENLIKDLEQEITELKRRNTELEKITNTEDHLHLIQISLLFGRIKSSKWFLIVLVGIFLVCCFISFNPEKLSKAEFKWMQRYAVDVTLDPDTANPKLILSDDNKQVRYGGFSLWKPITPDNPKRFAYSVDVLAKQGFSSGKFYYEVQVKEKTEWVIGVARESVSRKEPIMRTPVNGFWTVWMRNENEYKANADPSVSLCLRESPQKVGVFVDYEEGLVSFYDVESRSHIYSFTHQSFNEKLYPFFSPGTDILGWNSGPLVITPVNIWYIYVLYFVIGSLYCSAMTYLYLFH